MNQKIIVATTCLLIFGSKAYAADYQKPIAQCLEYSGNAVFKYPRCPFDFKKNCLANNGVVEGIPYGPAVQF